MDTFSALADLNRRSILELLAKSGTLSATDISDKFKVSPQAISQHLKVLREAKIVNMQKDAQRRLYTINTQSILELEKWASKIVQTWGERFDAIDKVLLMEKEKIKIKQKL